MNQILRQFQNNFKIRKYANRKCLNKNKLLSSEHTNKIELFLKNNIGTPLHIWDIKKILVGEFPILEGISNNTISRKMKSGMKFSYQLFSKIPQIFLIEEMFRKLLESSLLLKNLEASNTEWIYIGEFSFQPRHFQYYDGCAKRNSKPTIT